MFAITFTNCAIADKDRILIEDGIDNDAYDYAHFRIVPRKAYIQQERYEDDDDGDGYEEYTGPFTAATEQNTEEIYVNQTLTTENLNETLQRNPSDHQKKENDKKDQIPLGKCNNYENVENEDCNFINQSQINNCTIYENIKLNVNTIEKVVNVQSKSVNAKTVNEFTAVNTRTIIIDHAENMNIHNVTNVHFINVNVEKPAKESDKKSNTW
ncbi:unnamed protein product [Mytilus coruscus]|uniref:Uncharacterized protein n=1 Tax=Mytilus coruscus TaxID=42192 RepID=A0A6J8A1H8_MYTCO|nr:unnamed protein product [Mytilus coruscus]